MSTSQRVSRGFHRLGLLLAGITLAIGLVLIAIDAVKLKLWDVGPSDVPVVVMGVLAGFIEVGIACLVVYGVVRAIGWVIGGFAAS
jgi:hypothetical protein